MDWRYEVLSYRRRTAGGDPQTTDFVGFEVLQTKLSKRAQRLAARPCASTVTCSNAGRRPRRRLITQRKSAGLTLALLLAFLATGTAAAQPLGAAPLAIRTAGLEPTITEVTPPNGSTAGGTSVTIKGTNLGEATKVEFGGQVVAPTEDTASSIKLVTPEHAAGSVAVKVTTAGGSAEKAEAFTYVAGEPAVTEVTPPSGPTIGTTEVTIHGTNLTAATAVEFGGQVVAPTEDTASSIKLVTPEHAAGSVAVKVTTAGGSAEKAEAFTYVAGEPTVTGVTPSSGPTTGGTEVTIHGTNLTAATVVEMGGKGVTPKADSASSITLVTPEHAAGPVAVKVTTAGGSAEKVAAFTYLVPPGKEQEPVPAPKEKESPSPPPPGPAAAKCTMKPIFLTVERKRKRKARPRITAGQLKVTVTCSEGANVTLAGKLAMAVGKKPKHGKQRTKVYSLGPSTVTAAQGVASMVAIKLPLKTVIALVAKTKESVRISLNATNAGGSTHNSVVIKQLKA